MTIFEQREKAAEREYILRTERSFRVRARRDKTIAVWAAHLLGRDAQTYIDEIIEIDLSHGDDGVLLKLHDDLSVLGLAHLSSLIHDKMQNCLAKALMEVDNES